MVDALSQRPRHLDNTKLDKEEDINNQIITKLRAYKICLVRIEQDTLKPKEERQDPKLLYRNHIL